MIGADQIAAEFVAQIDEQLGKVTDELASMAIRIADLRETEQGLRVVRARLLGETAKRPEVAPATEAVASPPAAPEPELAAPVAKPIRNAQPLDGGLWSPDEDEAVRDLWPTARAACYLELSHRTPKAVDMRAYNLGIRARGVTRPTAATDPFARPRREPAPTVEDQSPEFQAQLARVRAGAPLIDKPVIRRADPLHSLGGTVGEIMG